MPGIEFMERKILGQLFRPGEFHAPVLVPVAPTESSIAIASVSPALHASNIQKIRAEEERKKRAEEERKRELRTQRRAMRQTFRTD